MKVSVVTPTFNSARFLEATLRSVALQRAAGLEVEHLVMDAGSTDGTLELLKAHAGHIAVCVSEPDNGPAQAINKGFARASGDVLCWLNADDTFQPGALARVAEHLSRHPDRALCFGHCPIVDESDREIRRGITRFKERFFPLSCRFTIQCINYLSQPATFFRRAAWEQAGPLREDLTAAWDYDFILRAWRHGGAVHVPRPALAAFRWHAASISGTHFRRQFAEEWQAAARDAGRFSPQALLHLFVRWGIVGAYGFMQRKRART